MVDAGMRPGSSPRTPVTRLGTKHSGVGVGGGGDDDLRGCYANLKHCCGAIVDNEEMV